MIVCIFEDPSFIEYPWFEGPSVENSQALEGRGKGKMLAMKTVILKQVPSKLTFV